MSNTTPKTDVAPETEDAEIASDNQSTLTAVRENSRSWWIKLFVQPLLLLAAGAALIVGLGMAQKLGWITAGGGGPGGQAASSSADTRTYICPMLCTPPQIGPGRCPVCQMELVPAAGGAPTDAHSVQIDPVARRLAHIETAPAQFTSMEQTIRAVGELTYDEGSLKTIAAYVDGRLDRLYADYTGMVVAKGDHLALVYSPRLYSAQVELLLAKRAWNGNQSATLGQVRNSSRSLYQSAKQRLIELGMTEDQIDQLEAADEANSRMHLCAPISGTVIEKLAVEGQYVTVGQAIYQLADLSTVWLMLELFPEDAAAVRYGQKVEADVHSLPGHKFEGRVAFLDPTVDPKKRTVGVRVVIQNDDGLLRVGDYARATIRVPLGAVGNSNMEVFDPELAGKWISPRHPHIVASSPGLCPVCSVELVPAAQYGFVDHPTATAESLTIPRTAVLMNGGHSVAYVETDPGRFEIRHVVLGASNSEHVVVLEGLNAGEQVATSGNFLIDSQMQLAGNPSLIDPTKAKAQFEFELDEGELPPIRTPQIVGEHTIESPPPGSSSIVFRESLASSSEETAAQESLPDDDRRLAEQQKVCPVTGLALGSMGGPIKVIVEGQPVFICCEGCRKKLLAEPAKYLAKLAEEAAQ